jgi:hypothetical protein
LRQEGKLKPHRALLNSEFLKVVSYGVNHAHLVLESGNMIEAGQSSNILDACHRHTERHSPVLSDHGIGAQPTVAS